MALSSTTITMSYGINYTATTDSSVDWSAVTNNTYFYDKTNKIAYYKNGNGTVVNPYDIFTGGTVSGQTIFISGVSANTLNITTQPTSGITSTQILMRNSTTGDVEITDNTSPTVYNFGLSYAMTNNNFTT